MEKAWYESVLIWSLVQIAVRRKRDSKYLKKCAQIIIKVGTH